MLYSCLVCRHTFFLPGVVGHLGIPSMNWQQPVWFQLGWNGIGMRFSYPEWLAFLEFLVCAFMAGVDGLLGTPDMDWQLPVWYVFFLPRIVSRDGMEMVLCGRFCAFCPV
ncbi:hypothetical protein Nepgr_017472 [Nepenthes gracilis]|uniref:Uncharacterized protein n=1 Tax=Nepenthes gracilis TaxID=150966 RepID=A0AAD3XTE1_NEPGR|nr:hypothetical protein Nepgr_017472 [Nepenthes gracilis]